MAQTYNDEVGAGSGSIDRISGHGPRSAVSWSSILAGAFAGLGISLIFLVLGSGLGFAFASPWPDRGMSTTALTVNAAVWLVVAQWVSAGVGGYLAGRLRTRWLGTHVHEVFFRDTAHGLITWAVTTVAVFALAVPWAESAPWPDAHVAVSSVDLDLVRKAAAETAIYFALSLLIGAFISSVAAAIGGRQRDLHI